MGKIYQQNRWYLRIVDQQRRIPASLLWRMCVAIVLLGLVSVPIALVAVLGAGVFGWLVLVWSSTIIIGSLTASELSYIVVGLEVFRPIPTIGILGVVLGYLFFLMPARAEIRWFRSKLGVSDDAAETDAPELVAVTRRLAQQGDIPEPELYITDRDRPASYAVGGQSDGSIVLTRGMVETLSDEQLTAVLAHEISHLKNGDSRIVGMALVPMIVAEHLRQSARPSREDVSEGPLWPVIRLLVWVGVVLVVTVPQLCSKFGVALLSRGREFAADRGAAQLTGSPATLASALETLTETRSRPSEDLRTWKEAAGVLDILPAVDHKIGLFRTHPDTEARIQRLQEMTAEFEQSGDRSVSTPGDVTTEQ